MGKSRLAHLKPMTVPRIELSAAVLAVQLVKSLREELDIPIAQSTFWSDSTCVIQYIRNQSKRFHTFVANRLSVIHENSEPHQWRHVRSELNPADDVRRSPTVDEVILNSKWLMGPQFLSRESKFWPLNPTLHQPELTDDDPEIKHEVQAHSQSSACHHDQDQDVLSHVIKRYSSWEKLRRAVAWLLRFKAWFIERCNRGSASASTMYSVANPNPLSVDEVQVAEREIFKQVQRHSFPDVIQALQEVGPSCSPRQVTAELKNLKIPTYIRQLHLLLDDKGLLRVGGRLESALIDYEAKHPIALTPIVLVPQI